jgi:hypothetical protein
MVRKRRGASHRLRAAPDRSGTTGYSAGSAARVRARRRPERRARRSRPRWTVLRGKASTVGRSGVLRGRSARARTVAFGISGAQVSETSWTLHTRRMTGSLAQDHQYGAGAVRLGVAVGAAPLGATVAPGVGADGGRLRVGGAMPGGELTQRREVLRAGSGSRRGRWSPGGPACHTVPPCLGPEDRLDRAHGGEGEVSRCPEYVCRRRPPCWLC